MFPVWLRILTNLPNDSECLFLLLLLPCPDSLRWLFSLNRNQPNEFACRTHMCCSESDHNMLLKSPRRRSLLLSFNEQPVENAVPMWFHNHWFYDVYFVKLDEAMSVMCCDLMSHISLIHWSDEDDDAVLDSFVDLIYDRIRSSFAVTLLARLFCIMASFQILCLDIPGYFLY